MDKNVELKIKCLNELSNGINSSDKLQRLCAYAAVKTITSELLKVAIEGNYADDNISCILVEIDSHAAALVGAIDWPISEPLHRSGYSNSVMKLTMPTCFGDESDP